MARNEITADFSGGSRFAETESLWQWDYGQVLIVSGIPDLPSYFETHFASKGDAETITALGQDGRVEIPNQLLEKNAGIVAYIYLHTGSEDGETEYRILIPVQPRQKPGDEQPDPHQQSVIDEAIAALETAEEQMAEALETVEAAAEIVESANKAADRANTAAESIERMRFYVEDGYLIQTVDEE